MHLRIILSLICGVLLFSSSAVMAHNGVAGTASIGHLLHMFTGEHLAMLVLAGVCAVFVTRLYRRLR